MAEGEEWIDAVAHLHEPTAALAHVIEEDDDKAMWDVAVRREGEAEYRVYEILKKEDGWLIRNVAGTVQ